jgi:tRNA-dihydrouridine synthase B
VIANGDIDGPRKAAEVLRLTGCDAVMVGRAAQGNPWIFGQIAHFLATGETFRRRRWPRCATCCSAISKRCMPSMASHRACASPATPGLVCQGPPESAAFRATVNAAETPGQQIRHHP